MSTARAAFEELSFYTLAHGDPAFLHQHIVDAFAAQHATDADKPIRLAFALVGLYLHVEKKSTGRQVQLVHMQLGRRRQAWPTFALPKQRGAIGIGDVLAAAPGPKRDAMIHRWCEAAWSAFKDQQAAIEALLDANEIRR